MAVAIPAVPAVTATAFKKVRRGIRVFGGIPTSRAVSTRSVVLQCPGGIGVSSLAARDDGVRP
jgi:hypothetical protein